MKINSIIMIMLACLGLFACGQGDKLNAANDKSLYRSVTWLQRSVPAKQQVEFQVAFWSLKQYATNESEFRKQVHRKTVLEIIELGKENFARQSQALNPEFTKFASWDAMIEKLTEERKQSELRPHNDARDKGNLIHSM
ncbi:MAG: hypothetical protein ACRERS_01655 [Methylococcales bacterium]